MVRRRSYSQPDTELTGQRRTTGGVRREATERITLRDGDFSAHGWTLNLSRGGVRVVLEDNVDLGAEYTIYVGPEDDPDTATHQARVVWLQDEEDGQIAGIEFLDGEGGVPEPDAPKID